MANMCDVMIIARFKSEEDRKACESVFLQQNVKSVAWVALNDVSGCYDYQRGNDWLFSTSGWCKWSVTDSLLDGSYLSGHQMEYPNLLSIQDLAERFHAYFEILGTEEGNNVGEHIGISPDGRMELEEYFDFKAYSTICYNSYDDFVDEYGPDELTEDEFNSDDYVTVGEPDTPFGEWIENRR